MLTFVWAGCNAGASGRSKVGRLELTDVGGHIEFLARDRSRNQVSKVGAGTTRIKETIIEENVKIEVDGFLYHPNLMEFTLAGLFGLLQYDFENEYSGRVRSSGDNGNRYEFDLNTSFMKKKPYPGSVFARRHRMLQARPFQSSLETTTTNYGLIWQYVDPKMPTNFQFNHTNVDLVPLSNIEEPGQQQNTQWRFETAYRVSDNNRFSLVLDRLSVMEKPYNIDYDSNEATLGHRLSFGSKSAHRLDSELNYFDQKGTFDVERIRWRELLRLEHSETLRSRYQLEWLHRTQGNLAGVQPLTEESYRAFAEIEHELYDSLISQLQVHGQTQQFNSGLNINRYGAYVNFDYRKTNPWGVLVANYRAGILREDRSGGDQLVEVLDEIHTFRDPEPITLSSTNIQVDTILITAEDKTTIYQKGRDYTLRTVGDRIEIERVAMGRIVDGQAVLIDYVNFIGGDYTLDTLTQFLNIRQDFDFGVSPYYRLQWQDQTINPVNARGAIANDIAGHTLGVEYRWKDLRLKAEYQDYDSTITPYKATRLSADYTHRFRNGATGALKARWSDMSYLEPNERQLEFFTIEGRYRHPITEHLTVEGSMLYRTEDDSFIGVEEGVDIDLTLEWIIRQTEFRVTYEYGTYEDIFATNDNQGLYVQLKRRF